MKEILEQLASGQGWVFDYGRNDFHNLLDESKKNELNENKIFLLLDPVKLKKNMNDSGGVESITYSGSFLLLVSSDFDEISYDFRYENYIKPLREFQLELILNELTCEQNASIQDWNETEVINVLDNNLDGILVSYQVNIEYEEPIKRSLTIPEIDGSTFPVTGVSYYSDGQTIEVTAFPPEGFVFEKFTENGIDKLDNPLTVVMNENKVIVPFFIIA